MDIDALLAEIAKKNGIVVSRKDPIMIVHTVIEFLYDQTQANLNLSLRDFRSQIEKITLSWKESIEQQSKEDINNYINNNKMEIRKIILEIISQTQKQMESKINNSYSDFEDNLNNVQKLLNESISKDINRSKIVAFINLISSIIVMTSVLILIINFSS